MKYIICLVLGLRARLATSNCAAEETAFNSCYTALTDSTYDENPFTYWEDDDESMSLPDCAGASATFNDRCASGPAECPASGARVASARVAVRRTRDARLAVDGACRAQGRA